MNEQRFNSEVRMNFLEDKIYHSMQTKTEVQQINELLCIYYDSNDNMYYILGCSYYNRGDGEIDINVDFGNSIKASPNLVRRITNNKIINSNIRMIEVSNKVVFIIEM